ncbi:DUF1801 domain-containing protein [Marinilongibacter aquaticus]|uniref:YdeI/OmpD-associated family protein n=1 Tax=Marinilongibacter aquaticus TaxID=2975157 RepID=UPI0021BDD5F1|nr:DUF1801 domain-containing protein [Marinilongibacter aquaticus]UBM59541.1 DUF1801 domain-containing protein [Marinilongibacter aquaticus]
MNPEIDHYLSEGCGRCPLGGTPDCKVHLWPKELVLLRKILLDCGLTEELKWSMPCYTYKKKNILMLSAFKSYCALSFFKGALLQDTAGLLEKPGENTQSARLIKFTNTDSIRELESELKAYIFEAIEIEKAGLKVEAKEKEGLVLVDEFAEALAQDAAFKAAFEALTPGRQRGYNLYFSAPKQAKTRIARIEKYKSKILTGLGFHD